MSDMSALAVSPALRLAFAPVQRLYRLAIRLRIEAELAAMDDRTLADLGLNRADIKRLARTHAASV
jgi:uncharacterized protein YjiS (DUF1127 family)